jgi:hypothetical protein
VNSSRVSQHAAAHLLNAAKKTTAFLHRSVQSTLLLRRPILQVQEPAEGLLRSLEVVRTGRAETALLGGAPIEFALECPLMSLPAIFGATVDTVPWSRAYLHADVQHLHGGQRSLHDP